ncbi:hypothetical protein D3C76_1358260 [compost metagenome]
MTIMVAVISWVERLGKSPMLPAETWAFWVTMAALTSAGVRLKAISFCGSIQMRIARSAPYSWALPTPSRRLISFITLRAR